MKNNLSDLNDYLFEQIERINDDEVQGEELENVIKKAEVIANISEKIIKNAELQFKAMCKASDYGLITSRQVKHLLSTEFEGE